MANNCAICGAEINLLQTQKLADGSCICRKSCRAKGFKAFDYVHANLYDVKAHLEQVERGTRLWNHYFVPRKKAKKLTRFGSTLFVAEDIGLMTVIQNDYKFMMFGKTTRACVYRIADLRAYNFEEQLVSNGRKTQKEQVVRLSFINTAGLYEVLVVLNTRKEFEKLAKYFDTLFGVQKTLGNAANLWKQQISVIKSAAAGISAAVKGDPNVEEKAAEAITSLDAAIYGDRTEWIRKADEALAAVE